MGEYNDIMLRCRWLYWTGLVRMRRGGSESENAEDLLTYIELED